jgi:murein DD-endopeptidase MepM/ murein hydrolase activator NlpD
MTFIKGQGDVSSLLTDTKRQNSIDDLDRMGLDLRNMDGATKEAKIRRIAIQFEEMLINTLVKDAFKENQEGKEDMIFKDHGTRDLTNMFLSQYIADNGGLGYRSVIEEQLKQQFFNNDEKMDKGVTKALKDLPIVNSHVPLSPADKSLIPGPPATPHEHKEAVPARIEQPVEAGVSSDFGWRRDPIDGKTRFHNGIDFSVPPNTPVKSVMEGEVVFSGREKGYGLLVEIKHPDGYTSRYGHNSKLLVKKGQKVKAGEVVARSGSSGRSTGPHLHFEIRKEKLALDPARFLKKNNTNVFARKVDIPNEGL